MNAEQLREIRERCDAATPGPWMTGALNPYRDRAAIYQTSEAQKVNPFHWQVRAVCREVRTRDADFIEHARADIPALLAEVARLRWALETIFARETDDETLPDIRDIASMALADDATE